MGELFKFCDLAGNFVWASPPLKKILATAPTEIKIMGGAKPIAGKEALAPKTPMVATALPVYKVYEQVFELQSANFVQQILIKDR